MHQCIRLQLAFSNNDMLLVFLDICLNFCGCNLVPRAFWNFNLSHHLLGIILKGGVDKRMGTLFSLHYTKKWSFPLWISSVNVTQSEEILNGKLHWRISDIKKAAWVKTKRGQVTFSLVKKADYIQFLILSHCSTDEAIRISSSPGLEPNTCHKEQDSILTWILYSTFSIFQYIFLLTVPKWHFLNQHILWKSFTQIIISYW